jgi:hypothetical protein
MIEAIGEFVNENVSLISIAGEDVFEREPPERMALRPSKLDPSREPTRCRAEMIAPTS